MKRKRKAILGYLGLVVVVTMTIVAATIQTPGASAVESIVDVIKVRVVGTAPNAKFEKPSENLITTTAIQNIIFDYENATDVRLSITYTNKDGTITLPDYKIYHGLDFNAGTKEEVIDLSSNGFSYGKYVLSLYATGSEGTEVQYDSVAIDYTPIIATAHQNEDDGYVDVTIDSITDKADTVDVYVDGKYVKTVIKEDFDKIIKLPMDGKPTGTYTVELIPRDANGESLYLPYDMNVYYEGMKIPDTSAPDTGQFFHNLNISREDYLITGILIFFVIGIVAFGVVAHDKKGHKKH